MDWLGEEEPTYGAVLVEDGLAFALIHGESLVACAAWALGAAGITHVDASVPWASIREAGAELGAVFVLHDALCPMVPPAFLEECVRRARADDAAVVAVRPVTDTVKRVEAGVVGQTVDRDSLRVVTAPVVLPARLLGLVEQQPTDLAALAAHLQESGDVILVDAPPEGRRVASPADVLLLEALTAATG